MAAAQLIGSWVRQRREALGLTWNDLAHAVGCAAATIRDLETSKRLLSPHILARLTASLTESDGAVRRSTPRIHHLPAQVTSFVGREHELALLVTVLRDADTRLVTLTGPGGSGKTRLALRAGELADAAFVDGCCLVDLSAVIDPRHVAGAIARALRMRAAREEAVAADLISFLHAKRLLLILDNYEQVIAAATLVSDILSAAPAVKILVTSRVALHLYGEYELPLGPLALPDPRALPHEILATDAVRLFVSRSGAAVRADQLEGDAQAFAAICRRLDGLPLAIELAAAQLKRFTPAMLLAQLTTPGALDVLSGGPRNAPPRHQTLRATIGWSVDLLAPAEQAIFARLGVFSGAFDRDAARAICAAEMPEVEVDVLLEGLVSQSLLQIVRTPAHWFVMLETIREYALEQLRRRDEEARQRQRHLAYFAELSMTVDRQIRGSERQACFDLLDAAYPNIQAALSWGLEAAGDHSAAIRLVGALWFYWRTRGLFSDAAHWLDAPALYDGAVAPLDRARALAGLAWVLERQGTYSRMLELALAALALARQTNDRPTMLRALLLTALEDRDRAEAAHLRHACLELSVTLDDPWLRCQTQRWYGRPAADAPEEVWRRYWREREERALESGDPWLMSELYQDQFARAMGRDDTPAMRRIIDAHRLLARQMNSRQALALTYEGQAWLAIAEERYDEALGYQQDRLEIERDLGNRSGMAWAGMEIAWLQLQAADLPAAECSLADALANVRSIADELGITRALCLRSLIRLWRGDSAAAAEDVRAFLLIARSFGRQSDFATWNGMGQWCLALAAWACGDCERAITLFGEALKLLPLLPPHGQGVASSLDAEAALAALRMVRGESAAAVMDAVIERCRAIPNAMVLLRGLWWSTRALLSSAAYDRADAACCEGLALARRLNAALWAADLLEMRAVVLAERAQLERAAEWWGAALALRERAGLPRWPVDQPGYAARIQRAKAALGAPAFAAACAMGGSRGWECLLDEQLGGVTTAQPPLAGVDLVEEVAAAAAIQAGLLPAELPSAPGWRFAARLVPARETAGDFYDCFTLPDGCIGLVVADVAGKGLGPALYMATGRALIRTLVGAGVIEPDDVLARLNNHLLRETHADLFITAFYGALDPVHGVLRYANAGHPPPLLLNPNEPARVRRLAPTGMALGVLDEATWTRQTISFAPGDTMLCYTDGVTEAQDSAGGFFETDRLLAVLRAHVDRTAEQIVAAVYDALHTFAAAAAQADDITLLAVGWES